MGISAYGRARDWRRALSLLSEMFKCGVSPDVISFSAGISACGKGGQWQRALSLLDEMRELGVSPNVIIFIALMQTFASSGRVEEGFALLQDFEAAGLADTAESYVVHRTLLEACRASGTGAQVDRVQTAMSRRGLSAAAAVVAGADLFLHRR